MIKYYCDFCDKPALVKHKCEQKLTEFTWVGDDSLHVVPTVEISATVFVSDMKDNRAQHQPELCSSCYKIILTSLINSLPE